VPDGSTIDTQAATGFDGALKSQSSVKVVTLCIFAGADIGSINELGRMESPGSKRRYREENDNCKHKRSASNGTSSLRTARVGNLPSNRKVAFIRKKMS